MKRISSLAFAVAFGLGGLFMGDDAFRSDAPSLVTSAEAVIGRPATPMSYAGVARRTTRRAVAAGAAMAPVYVAPRPGCVQVVDAYGRVYYRCP